MAKVICKGTILKQTVSMLINQARRDKNKKPMERCRSNRLNLVPRNQLVKFLRRHCVQHLINPVEFSACLGNLQCQDSTWTPTQFFTKTSISFSLMPQ